MNIEIYGQGWEFVSDAWAMFNMCQCLLIISFMFGSTELYVTENGIESLRFGLQSSIIYFYFYFYLQENTHAEVQLYWIRTLRTPFLKNTSVGLRLLLWNWLLIKKSVFEDETVRNMPNWYVAMAVWK